jgi:hypothetical protein
MGGGLMQLVAYGAQDIYLTGNPQITFFKVVYRRHTNFSMEAIQQTFNGTVGQGESVVTATISRNGDLVSNLWIDALIDRDTAASGKNGYLNFTNNTGHALVKDCEIEIGGQRIDRHYSQWLDVLNELTDHNEEEWLGLNKHGAKNAFLTAGNALDTDTKLRLYVPLKFWFCRNPGLALPLIALQYHEVKVKVTLRNIVSLFNAVGTLTDPNNDRTVQLWADYIYLDTDERRRFAQVSHEYLIEQVQRESGTMSGSSHNQKLNFNHPVKELIWTVQTDAVATEGGAGATDIDATANVDGAAPAEKNDYFNYTTFASAGDIERIGGQVSYEGFATSRLQLNGHDRFASRNASYFRTCQPLQCGHKVPSKHIYCYSFALKPEEHQPSGTCNFSRIDNAKMIFTTAQTYSAQTLTVWAVNYNVLRIMSGMGGLAYSN